MPAGCRVQVELEFVLDHDQRGRHEPDLDNLIKAAIDALDGGIGPRTGTGSRVEADDVRVDQHHGIQAQRQRRRAPRRPHHCDRNPAATALTAA